MEAYTFTSTRSSEPSRSRAAFADPFYPVRRGRTPRSGQRALVLTRRQQQTRDERAHLERVAAEGRAQETVEWQARFGLNDTFAGVSLNPALSGWPQA